MNDLYWLGWLTGCIGGVYAAGGNARARIPTLELALKPVVPVSVHVVDK
jgi:hypothetical protein